RVPDCENDALRTCRRNRHPPPAHRSDLPSRAPDVPSRYKTIYKPFQIVHVCGDRQTAYDAATVRPSPTARAMSALQIATFLLAALLGSYVQSVAGFAMGLMIIASVSSLRLVALDTASAVVSLLSFVNIALSLRGHYHLVHGRILRGLVLGQ